MFLIVVCLTLHVAGCHTCSPKFSLLRFVDCEHGGGETGFVEGARLLLLLRLCASNIGRFFFRVSFFFQSLSLAISNLGVLKYAKTDQKKMMETQLKDPSCRTLLFAFKQKQHHCVLREDFKGASQAKLQAAEVTRLGRQLDACRALHKASIDSSKATSDINLDDVDAVRKIRNRKDQKMKRDVMREREEEALLNRLDVMREEAISQSRAVGVVVGLDSFLSSKQIIKDQIEEEKLILGDGNSILHDDDGMELSSLADLSSGIHIKVETYINLHAKLESTMVSEVQCKLFLET